MAYNEQEYGSTQRHRRADAHRQAQQRREPAPQPVPARRPRPEPAPQRITEPPRREPARPRPAQQPARQPQRPQGGYNYSATPAMRPVNQQKKPERIRKPASRKRSNPRRSVRSTLIMIPLLLVFAVAATAGIVGYTAYSEIMDVRERETFYRGVYVNGYELYGASPQEAYNFILERAREGLSGWNIQLTYGSDFHWQITSDTLDITSSLENVVSQAINEAYAVGRRGTLVEAYEEISALKKEPKYIYTSDVTKSDARIDLLLAEIKNTVDVPAEDAVWEFMPDRQNPIVVTAETYGKSLNLETLKAQVMQLVNDMQPGTIEIVPDVVVPNVKAEQITNSIVRLASYSTTINKNSTPERNLNIERGCAAFHGKTIKAGEKVSFNKWVGKRDAANGFYQGLEIVYGEYQMGWGGGICQVSSTLYNAVIEAGMKINTRRNHALVPNYIEMGKDATVADRGIDFVFTNNTGADVYCVARLVTSGNTKSCLFEFYGRPDPNGYTYELATEVIEVLPIPETTPIPDKKAEHVIYTDQTEVVSDGEEGHKVRVYLLTKDQNGTLIDMKELYTDTYKPTAPRVYVGVTPR